MTSSMDRRLAELLAEFRIRLATDPHLRNEFEAAPLGVMRRSGVQVSPEQARRFHLDLARGPHRAPATTISLRDQRQGEHGWLLAAPTITLSAQDFSGTGIAAIETSPDRASWVAYTGPFTYAAEGDTKLFYRGRDNALTAEPANIADIKIDTRAPSVIITIDQPTYTRVQPFMVHVSASDPSPGSGLASFAATLDTTAVSNAQDIDLLWYPLGAHAVSATASDVAGWTTTESASFELIATRESLVGVIRKLATIGHINSGGVTTSLVRKARRGPLTALLNEIHAQSGKHMTVASAALLAADVEYVIAHQLPRGNWLSRLFRWLLGRHPR